MLRLPVLQLSTRVHPGGLSLFEVVAAYLELSFQMSIAFVIRRDLPPVAARTSTGRPGFLQLLLSEGLLLAVTVLDFFCITSFNLPRPPVKAPPAKAYLHFRGIQEEWDEHLGGTKLVLDKSKAEERIWLL